MSYSIRVSDKDSVLLWLKGVDTGQEYRNPLVITTTHKQNEEGDWVVKQVSLNDLFFNHATPVSETEVDLNTQGMYEPVRNKHGGITVKMSGTRSNDITPVYSADCEAWMRKITNVEYDKVMSWVANSTDYGLALPIFSIIGGPNTGKTLLQKAILEQLENPGACLSPAAQFEEPFNGELVTNPFLLADDGGINIDPSNRDKWKDRLKQFITLDKWKINVKYGGQYTMKGFLRCYCAFNKDQPAIRSLFNVVNPALGTRILDIEVSDTDAKYITDKFESKQWDAYGEDSGRKWLGEEGELVQHVSWIIANKHNYKVPERTGRWGNLGEYKFKGSVASNRREEVIYELLQTFIDRGSKYCLLVGDTLVIDPDQTVSAFKMENNKHDFLRKDLTEILSALGGTYKNTRTGKEQKRMWHIPVKGTQYEPKNEEE
jgi:hypothetical protein